ncbi:MAG: ATP-binding protein [Candidatus Sulfobium sp.]
MATLTGILERIEIKKSDYLRYNFSQTENNALKTFFDLAQEFGSIADFHILCVAVPKSFFDLDARLYLIDPKVNALSLAAMTEDGAFGLHSPPPADVKPQERPYYTVRKSLVLTIRGKKFMIEQLPFRTEDDVLGLLEVFPIGDPDPHTELFFEKYANRIGFRIHNKIMVEKNIEHLRFIRSLVADIEHNIIVPNMVYKLFLRRLRANAKMNKAMEQQLSDLAQAGEISGTTAEKVLRELANINSGFEAELENIEKHYNNMTLFIETLFRKSHFDQGRLTLRTKPCNMKKDVVLPQIERYLDQFVKAGISIDDRMSGIPDEEVINVVDVGLIAQVYANLFSNALKYTQEILTDTGERKKYIAYGHGIIKDYFGEGKDGVKYNVFSTGPHIPEEERPNLFKEEFRASNALDKPGTGHGLSFIRNAVEIHGGVAGYEATKYGNNFYFIIPK